MAGILDFQQYIGGADQIKIEQAFPKDQKNLVYNFQQNITGWQFELDYQTIVVDEIAFNRNTGQPNFANSTVIGTFAKVELAGQTSVINAALGTVRVTFPQNMYTGPIIPDARQNVPIVVVALTWTDANSPANIHTHRWALIQCWEPDVAAGDPTLHVNYTALTVA